MTTKQGERGQYPRAANDNAYPKTEWRYPIQQEQKSLSLPPVLRLIQLKQKKGAQNAFE